MSVSEGERDEGRFSLARPRWDLEAVEPVKTETPAAKVEPEKTVGGKVVTITATSLNVRVGDSQKYDSVGTVKKGEKYEWVATSPTTGWHAIRMDKRIGWVSPNYSKVEAA